MVDFIVTGEGGPLSKKKKRKGGPLYLIECVVSGEMVGHVICVLELKVIGKSGVKREEIVSKNVKD